MPICNRQHVVPRFVIGGFNDNENSAWINTVDGMIVRSGPAGKYYWENNIYGADLDDSWRGYEGFASNVIGTIRAGGNTINGKSYWYSLKPYIAGLVARDRSAHYELSSIDWNDPNDKIMKESTQSELLATDWYRYCHALDPDAIRVILFSAALTSLITANMAIMRTSRSFIINDSGYAWDGDEEKMLVPLSSNAMIVVSWPESSLNGKTFIEYKDDYTLRAVTRDARVANGLLAKQAHQVTATLREDAEHYKPLNAEHGFIKWLTTWMPMRAIWNWVYPVAALASQITIPEGMTAYGAIKAFGRQVTWRPPYLVLPDDGVLYKQVHTIGDGSDLIMDTTIQPWVPTDLNWVKRPDLQIYQDEHV